MSEFPNHAALQEEAVYSLPVPLIDAICCETKGFLLPEDEQFERALSSAAPCGFFRKQPIFYPPLVREQSRSVASDEVDEKLRKSSANIREMLADDMRDRGVSSKLIDDYFSFAELETQVVEERRWSYAGWLATSPEFRQQRNRVRSLAKHRNANGPLPALPITITGQSHSDTDTSTFGDAWLTLYRLWGIESLATWELPIPMRPEMATSSLYPLSDICGAGLMLFVPWYLLRDRKITFFDLAERQQVADLPTALRVWLDPKPKNWGYKRYRVMLQLYVFLELGLRRRYAERTRGFTAKLDRAFGCFLSGDNPELSSDESIRKIRHEMSRRLRSR